MRKTRRNSSWCRIFRRAPRPRRRSTVTKHFATHRETARSVLTERVTHWNTFYNFHYNRIAIRNQRRRWGSCSSLRNLNFNYKLLFLPQPLQDYVVVHELCHLEELNHGPAFWKLVEQAIPDYSVRVQDLRYIETTFGTSIAGLTKAQAHYRSRATALETPAYDAETTLRLPTE